VHTPRIWGEPFGERRIRFFNVLKRKRNAGAFVFERAGLRPLRTSWLIVGTPTLQFHPHRRSPMPTNPGHSERPYGGR
jgi:hypothetical protein